MYKDCEFFFIVVAQLKSNEGNTFVFFFWFFFLQATGKQSLEARTRRRLRQYHRAACSVSSIFIVFFIYAPHVHSLSDFFSRYCRFDVTAISTVTTSKTSRGPSPDLGISRICEYYSLAFSACDSATLHFFSPS